jgi:enoyl-CoA hydratase/carnithine racemase
MNDIDLNIIPPLAEIVISRPSKHNAMSNKMWAALPTFIKAAEADATVKAILIHGGDSDMFSAGADLEDFSTLYATREGALAALDTLAKGNASIAACTKPVIAAIEGNCIGAGLSLAMAADLRVASAGAKFALPPAKLGLSLPIDDLGRVIDAIGKSATKDLLFTARVIEASEAKTMGLINRLAPRGEAIAMARALASDISRLSQWSHGVAKQLMAGCERGWDQTTPDAAALFVDGFEKEDFQEGITAFAERRAPNFK